MNFNFKHKMLEGEAKTIQLISAITKRRSYGFAGASAPPFIKSNGARNTGLIHKSLPDYHVVASYRGETIMECEFCSPQRTSTISPHRVATRNVPSPDQTENLLLRRDQ